MLRTILGDDYLPATTLVHMVYRGEFGELPNLPADFEALIQRAEWKDVTYALSRALGLLREVVTQTKVKAKEESDETFAQRLLERYQIHPDEYVAISELFVEESKKQALDLLFKCVSDLVQGTELVDGVRLVTKAC